MHRRSTRTNLPGPVALSSCTLAEIRPACTLLFPCLSFTHRALPPHRCPFRPRSLLQRRSTPPAPRLFLHRCARLHPPHPPSHLIPPPTQCLRPLSVCPTPSCAPSLRLPPLPPCSSAPILPRSYHRPPSHSTLFHPPPPSPRLASCLPQRPFRLRVPSPSRVPSLHLHVLPDGPSPRLITYAAPVPSLNPYSHPHFPFPQLSALVHSNIPTVCALDLTLEPIPPMSRLHFSSSALPSSSPPF